MNLKKIGKVFTSKFVGTGPSPYKKRIYLAAVSQRLRYTDLQHQFTGAARYIFKCYTSIAKFLRIQVLIQYQIKRIKNEYKCSAAMEVPALQTMLVGS